jgi:hypothetical protein
MRFSSKLIWLFHWNRYKYGIWTDECISRVFVIINKIWLHITYKIANYCFMCLVRWFNSYKSKCFFLLLFSFLFTSIDERWLLQAFYGCLLLKARAKEREPLSLHIYIHFLCMYTYIYSLLPISSIIWIKGTAIGGGVKLIRTLYLPPPASSFQCII